MTQKDKVKELVGRGLHSYHTKALLQMDRIEKKNKEQNHKISILSNELDNDYLTKTEEGSVVSLEHSKEGMVYLDELQGNTLVNYCTDGSKELTLNGDIDVEGTFVTTTEGVDNGKVDIMCEGNTLVNIANHPNAFTVTRTDGQGYRQYDVPLVYPLKANTTYTIYLTVENNEFNHNPFTSIVIGQGNTDNWSYRIYWNKEFGKKDTDKGLGRHKAIFTTHSRVEESSHKWIKFIFETYPEYNTTMKDIVLLEGEHSEDIDNFIGMKSVGQDNENGHKIEILSQNGNLYDYDIYTKPFGNYLSSHKIQSNGIKVKADNQDTRGCSFIRLYANEDLYISLDIVGSGGVTKKLADNTYIENYIKSNEKVRFKLEKGREYKIELNAGGTYDAEVLYDNIIISKNNYIDFIPRMFNKKEILLNEPLRGLPNGVKDRFVKIGGKFYIERNCGGKIITKDTTKFSLTHVTTTTNLGIGLVINKTLELADCFRTTADNFLLEGFVNGKSGQWYEKHWGAYSNDMNIVAVFPPTYTLDQMKDFIDGKQIIYKLKTPTYEPLEINPELICYNDTTHISNNSIIPCNMKVQNSGYNAIIKPSTLYTVTLDTNKSGTIGMNLGGVKGTTTNNVLTLTTPATLTDDSLRLHGKGIKGSKVRLLEGDKTNWIPSFFEGMKSCFEDKVQEDGTYKMEILSNNKNLLKYTIDNIYNTNAQYIIKKETDGAISVKGNFNKPYWLKQGFFIKKGEKYSVTVIGKKSNNEYSSLVFGGKDLDYFNGGVDRLLIVSNTGGNCITTIDNYGTYKITCTAQNTGYVTRFYIHGSSESCIYTIKDIQIEKANTTTDIIPHKSNKIQFSSIEPLRSVEHTKDRFIFKDNKLMIERNVGKVSIPSNFSVTVHRGSNEYYNSHSCGCYINTNIGNLIKTTNNVKEVVCKRFGYKYSIWGNGNYSEGICNIGGHGDGRIAMRIHNSLTGIVGTDSAEECSRKITNYLKANPFEVYYKLKEPTYEELPHELQKIILEGYENGTLFFDTNIPPTSTVTYAGETPIVKSVRLNKTEVLNNTNDINDNIIPYLMDMDYRVVCLQLESNVEGVSMTRLFGGTYEMLQRDILSNRYSVDEYRHRLDAYLSANKITEDEYNKLGDMLNE